MFDIGFWELAFIGVIALLVFGPERLPEVARTAGLWVSRIRRFIASVKRDVEQELRAEELKRILKQPTPLNEVHEILEETRQSLEKPVVTASPDTLPAKRSLESGAQPEGAEGKSESGALTSSNQATAPTSDDRSPKVASEHERHTAQN